MAPIAVISDRAGLGDGLMVCPLIWEIARRYPGRPIWWLAACSTRLVGLVAALMPERVERMVQLPRAHFYPTGLTTVLRHMPAFHRVFDVRSRFGDVAIARTFLRSDGFRLNTRLSAFRRPQQIIWRSWSTIEQDAGQPIDWQDAARDGFAISGDVARAVDRALPPGGHYFGIVITRKLRKGWPMEKSAALARLAIQAGFEPVFFAGPEEKAYMPDLIAAAPGSRAIPARFEGEPEDLFRLEFAAASARRMTVAVSPDSGHGHMLGISRVPLVSLFAMTDPARWAPYATKGVVIEAPMKAEGRTMDDIEPVPVFEAALSLVDAG